MGESCREVTATSTTQATAAASAATSSTTHEQQHRHHKSKSSKVVPKFYYYLYCLNISNIKNQMSNLKRNHFTRDGDESKSMVRSRKF